jgi:uncharacterized protein (AIM24 family)
MEFYKEMYVIIIMIMGGSYIAHSTNVSMRFTTSGGLFRAAYYGALAAEQLTIMRPSITCQITYISLQKFISSPVCG